MKENFLSGKNCLITGATGGIGMAIAHRLWNLGGTIHLTGRNLEKLELLKSLWSSRVHIYRHDLGTQKSWKILLEEVSSHASNVDVLVNNSGITKDGLALRMKDQDWEDVIHLNLSVPFFLSQGVISGMLKNKWGRIINITSVIGHKGNPGQCNYAASKAGLCGMTKSLALEVASKGITVNAVAPGFIETAMTQGLLQEARNSILEHTPCKFMGTPEDVAYAVQFLVSPEAKFITGQTLHVNGGMYMGG
ncbi:MULTISPECIES: 3-oxoacyl-ACP reductase FabG [Holospora]|uniref:3-oxoacyl-[acyl-carrier-protein] reductase FabG n=2 Tax=Holospora TaxID=44747 RepID=A0A061JHW3_9PROT|nr:MULTISPECIES: 3-oxoacyl-ACP reductase FabG [Holospora]ETZ04529.1 3-oxoacyl-[acyl-carrier-protein] reductase FabG [Holospora undulata HU1]GAJ46120.1 3-oxoacyl-[acyl-carrier-protein] reductase FabG [Holospora elegans E1]